MPSGSWQFSETRPKAAQRVRPLSTRNMRGWDAGGGFSVDASIRVEAHDRAGLERLLRYCARPKPCPMGVRSCTSLRWSFWTGWRPSSLHRACTGAAKGVRPI